MAHSGNPPAAAPIAVVGPHFSSPYPVDLTITQKFFSLTDRDFTVKDAEGNDVFMVKGIFLSFSEKRVLQDAAGNPIITLSRKIMTLHHRWNVFSGASTDDKDLLFSVKKSHLLQLKTTLDVFLAGNTEEKVCDFKVKGSFLERSCSVYHGESSVIIAQMKKQHKLKNMVLGKGSFGVTIFPNVDQAFIVALIMVLDEINKESGSSGGGGSDATELAISGF